MDIFIITISWKDIDFLTQVARYMLLADDIGKARTQFTNYATENKIEFDTIKVEHLTTKPIRIR